MEISPVLTREVIKAIVIPELPRQLRGYMPSLAEQKWGFALATDVHITETGLRLSGSFTASGDKAEFMAWAIARILEKRGYACAIGEMR